MNAEEYHNKHAGETCLVVSNGPNLALTPPELFDYPSFAINRGYRYAGWKPTYYVGVDDRNWKEYGSEIVSEYSDIPKFIPSPDQDDFDAPNLVRFKHRMTHGDLYVGGQLPNMREALTRYGITYRRILGAVFQIAIYMGFARVLVIGVQHKPGDGNNHFFGNDERGFEGQPLEHWFDEYRHWSRCGLTEILNISEDTHVPESVMTRGDYKDWINK